MPIEKQDEEGRDDYPGAKWFSPEQYEKVGVNGSRPLLLVGRLQSGEPIVATQNSEDPGTEVLLPAILDDLIRYAGWGIKLDWDPYPEKLKKLEEEYKDAGSSS